MTVQQKITKTIQSSGGNFVKENTYTGSQATTVSDTLAAGTTTFDGLGIDVSAMTSLLMYCSRDITITINDDGTPDATIALKANKILDWAADGYFTNPLGSVDVTSIKAVLAAGDDADLLIEALYDG